MKFYKDGVENSFSIPSNCTHSSNVTFAIGSSTQNGATQFFSGKSDEFRLWTNVRTNAEINANKDVTRSPSSPGLEIYYQFEEGTGTTSDNLAGTNYDATLNNGASWTTTPISGGSSTTYVWDNNVTDGTAFNPTATTTYSVTGTDANGCTGTDQVDVTINALPTVDAGTDQTVCAGTAVTLTASGASTYAWDNNVTDGTAFTPTATTSYSVTGTDANGCTATDAVDVTVNALPISTVSSMNALCNGSSDGSATVSSAGGTAPYTYLWDDGQTTAMAGALAAGSYTVTVTDANGCTETQSATVTEPTLLSSTVSSMNALCSG